MNLKIKRVNCIGYCFGWACFLGLDLYTFLIGEEAFAMGFSLGLIIILLYMVAKILRSGRKPAENMECCPKERKDPKLYTECLLDLVQRQNDLEKRLSRSGNAIDGNFDAIQIEMKKQVKLTRKLQKQIDLLYKQVEKLQGEQNNIKDKEMDENEF